MKYLLLLYSLISFSLISVAQDSLKYKEENSKKKGYSAPSKTARDLSISLEEKDDKKTAALYEKMAEQYAKKGEYSKSEQHYKQALALYKNQKNKNKIAAINRNIAQIQEQQKKTKEAISSYEKAAGQSVSKKDEYINTNDAQRLRNSNTPQAKRSNINANIQAFEESNEDEEAADAYKNLAEVELEEAQPQAAVANLERAIDKTKNEDKKVEIKQQIAATYAADKDYTKALKISEQLYNDAKEQENTPLQIQQLQQQAIYHSAKGSNEKQTVPLLKHAYSLAIQTNNTNAAKSVTESLVDYFTKQKDYETASMYYQKFLKDLDSLIINDSSIAEEKILNITEGRIRELENERNLQLQIIKNKNIFNYFLIGSIVLMILFLALIAKSLFAIKIKNKKIALQSLRREMNPHFIFNSLNSVNQFIAENDELQANKYLTSYSTLMRNVMEHSNKDFVTLSAEKEQLQQYLDLEHLRFKDKFDFSINIDEDIDTDAISIPNMLLQPQLENAIWHGLRYKETKGHLTLEFNKLGDKIKAVITDDGIGIEQSKAMKTFHQKAHKSIGISNTKERINLLNELYKTDISIEVSKPKGNTTGTIVTLTFPIIDKKYAQR